MRRVYLLAGLGRAASSAGALVYAHDDGTTLEQYTYHYWVDSPRLLLQQARAGRLRGAHRVVTAPSADARYTLRGHIAKFERQGTGTGASAEVSLEFETDFGRYGCAGICTRLSAQRAAGG